ncbi:MAG: dihydroorotase [bacterium]
MRICIKGARLIDPSQGMDGPADIWIREGLVETICRAGSSLPGATEHTRVLDAKGKVVVPGLVDMHVHLREPGQEYKETIQTGTMAAAAGGVTSLACMPNTDPVADHGAVIEFVLHQAQKNGSVRVHPVGAITKGLKGEALSEIGELREAGAVAISDDGKSVGNALVMRRAMEYARGFGLPVISHCEDKSLSGQGVMNEGEVSLELGLRGIPALAEEVMVARDLLLAEWTGCHLHIAHVSTAGSVRLIRDAKARGVKVTAEATPHHLILTQEAVRQWDTDTKVNPPLRTQQDVEALQEALRDGTIDVIATDHAPHARVDKEVEYDFAAFGISGLETLVGLTLMLVERGVLDLQEWVRKLSCNPARILGIKAGTLAPGSPADLVILDPESSWKVDPARFYSKGKNTPFKNWTLRGRVLHTMVGGRTVYNLES